MKRVALLVASSALAGALMLGVRSNGAEPSSAHRVAVHVKDAAGAFNIPRARVTFVSQAGATLAEATSDSDGIAYSTLKDERNVARVLVEAQGYYIGGLKWLPGARELCIHLALFRTCDLSAVAHAK